MLKKVTIEMLNYNNVFQIEPLIETFKKLMFGFPNFIKPLFSYQKV